MLNKNMKEKYSVFYSASGQAYKAQNRKNTRSTENEN